MRAGTTMSYCCRVTVACCSIVSIITYVKRANELCIPGKRRSWFAGLTTYSADQRFDRAVCILPVVQCAREIVDFGVTVRARIRKLGMKFFFQFRCFVFERIEFEQVDRRVRLLLTVSTRVPCLRPSIVSRCPFSIDFTGSWPETRPNWSWRARNVSSFRSNVSLFPKHASQRSNRYLDYFYLYFFGRSSSGIFSNYREYVNSRYSFGNLDTRNLRYRGRSWPM